MQPQRFEKPSDMVGTNTPKDMLDTVANYFCGANPKKLGEREKAIADALVGAGYLTTYEGLLVTWDSLTVASVVWEDSGVPIVVGFPSRKAAQTWINENLGVGGELEGSSVNEVAIVGNVPPC